MPWFSQMSAGKLLLFVVTTVIGGVVQLWILFLIFTFGQGKTPDMGTLLGDGGLFFFSTSLTMSSIALLYTKRRSKLVYCDSVITSLALVLIVSAAVIYAIVVYKNFSSSAPFGDHDFVQIACAAVAIVYGLYVGIRSGQFAR